MALYPCDACGSRYLGKSSAVYAAIDPGPHPERIRLRLCPPCFVTDLEDRFSAFTITVKDDKLVEGVNLPTWCVGCGRKDDLHPAFVTAYRAGSGRTDYFGRLCTECAALVVAELTTRPGPLASA